MSINQGMMSSYRQDYETPPEFMEALGINFDLDACCTVFTVNENNENLLTIGTNKAPKYFTEQDDALTKEWHGTVWMNPPYGKELSIWLQYAYEQSLQNYNDCVYCLVPARTDTQWFHKIAIKGHIILLEGRISFLQGGYPMGSPPFPSMLVKFNKVISPSITTWKWKKEKELW